jgi:hypothetical protein
MTRTVPVSCLNVLTLFFNQNFFSIRQDYTLTYNKDVITITFHNPKCLELFDYYRDRIMP